MSSSYHAQDPSFYVGFTSGCYFWTISVSLLDCDSVERMRIQAGQEDTAAENARRRLRTYNPLVLAVSLETGIERSTAENALPLGLVEGSKIQTWSERSTAKNARQRQRILYSLVSSKAQKTRRAASRLPRTLGRDREHSIFWFLLNSFAPGSGVGSES